MPLKFIGGIMAAIGMLMIFTHGAVKPEEAAIKQLFSGIGLVLIGLLLIFYSPI